MKKLLLVLLAICLTMFAFAQQGETESISDPDATIIGADSANFALREVSIDLFEREGSWNVSMSSDYGVISSRFFEGGPDPLGKVAVSSGTEELLPDSQAYGVKVEFFKRGLNSFFIKPAQPLAIDGVVKTVSVWVAGRNKAHVLTLLVQDYKGNSFELYMGTLDFAGWKRMVVAIPPSPDGTRGIVQDSAYFGVQPGLTVLGFRVDCDPVDASGTYYVYFDDLRAITDLYAFENSDPFDMSDNW